METITLQPILKPLVLTLVFGAALLMLFIGPSFSKLTSSRKTTLTLIRLGVIAMALLAALRPGCVKTIEKSQAAVLLFLIDTSRSMDLPHVNDDSSRWGATVDMIEENEERFRLLSENKIDVKFYGFDNQVRSLAYEDGKVALPDGPEGGETDIGTALYDRSLDVRDQRLIGVFVASDGQPNVPEPGIEISQAAQAVADMEVPLMPIQLGLPGDAGQLADVAITSFAEQQVVNKKNDLVARATMVARGYADQDIKVELIVTDDSGMISKVASEVYRPSAGYEEINVALKYRPTEQGEYQIKVRAVQMPNERAIRNNELDGFLTVRDQGMRVLFLNGALGFEQKFLQLSLPALDFVTLDFHPLYTYASLRKATWPLNQFLADFKDPKKYDVFILCNVDSQTLTDESWEALADAVRGGKGLLMIGGTHSFGAGQYHRTALAEVLPIKMKATEQQDFDQDILRELHINSPIKMRPVVDNYLTEVADTDNKVAWKKLPPLSGANRIAVKDTAEVYVESDDDVRRPILVGTNIGGRVLVFAGDSTWRWWRAGFKAEFNRFWRQCVLWLAKWDLRNDESVSIDLPKRRFSPKAHVKFGVSVQSISGEAVGNVSFEAQLVLPSGESQVITINQVGDRYESSLDPESIAQSGHYRIKVAAKRNGALIGESQRAFVVMDRDKEKANPVSNPEQMQRLASQTAEFGGKVLAPEDLADVLDEYIENPPTTKIKIPTKHRLGGDFWSSFCFLVVFVGLLAVEWLLRKKWGLV